MENIFLDYTKILSYNIPFIMIIGGRGIGKSYGAKKQVIKDFLKNGDEFIYLRRYKKELQETAKTFFNDINKNEEFKENFKFNKSNFYCEDKIMGYALSLNTSLIQKGISYPNVKTIIFDEFLIDSPVYHYLKNEVKLFLDFLESVFRMRCNIRVIMLSNSVNFNNPYFNFFHINNLKQEYNVIKERNLLIVLPKMESFKEVKKESTLYTLYKNTDYEKFNIENEFEDLSDIRFIAKLNNNCKYWFTINYNNRKFGVYKNYKDNSIIFSNKVNNECPKVIALSFDDLNTSSILAKGNNNYLKNLRLYLYNSSLFFETEIVQAQLKDIVDYIS